MWVASASSPTLPLPCPAYTFSEPNFAKQICLMGVVSLRLSPLNALVFQHRSPVAIKYLCIILTLVVFFCFWSKRKGASLSVILLNSLRSTYQRLHDLSASTRLIIPCPSLALVCTAPCLVCLPIQDAASQALEVALHPGGTSSILQAG